MKNGITRAQRFVGLDVHAETIAVAVAEGEGGEVRSLGIIPNREQSVKKLLGKLGPKESWTSCYEAGPTGYAAIPGEGRNPRATQKPEKRPGALRG